MPTVLGARADSAPLGPAPPASAAGHATSALGARGGGGAGGAGEGGGAGEIAEAKAGEAYRRSAPIGPSLPPAPFVDTANLPTDPDDDVPVTPMSAADLPPAYSLKVAVGLKQVLVEITVTPHTVWEAAKCAACDAAGSLDPTIHRLLFRGREMRADDTMAAMGVKPSVKLMLLETEASKMAKARAAAAAQMEEARLARQQHFAQQQQQGPPKPLPSPPVDPAERTAREVAVCMATVDVLQKDLEALEQRTADAEAAEAGGGAAVGVAVAPPDIKDFLHMVRARRCLFFRIQGLQCAA